MGLRTAVRSYLNAYTPHQRATSYSLGDLIDVVHTFQGNTYYGSPTTTLGGKKEAPIGGEFVSLVSGAYTRNGVVFAASLARMLVFSEVRFKFRRLDDKRLFGSGLLEPLEKPGPNQTTGELLARMEQDVTLDGNWYGTTIYGGIKRLRPDWVDILISSSLTPEHPGFGSDCTVVGYLYRPNGQTDNAVTISVAEMAHWSPVPDPVLSFRGMSWLEPVVREVMADNSGTDLRLRFYENGATPNMVVNAPEWVTDAEQYKAWKSELEKSSAGVKNAFRTLYLASGSSATSVGANLQQADFKAIQGAGETRIAVASRVPATLLGISEGLAGSSLNQGNYAMARRQFADGFLRPQWRSACAALATIIPVPAGAELWFDESEVAFLREDADAAAQIMQIQSAAIRQFIDAGYTPESARDAVAANDLRILEHTGLVSVQLQEPGAEAASPPDLTLVETA